MYSLLLPYGADGWDFIYRGDPYACIHMRYALAHGCKLFHSLMLDYTEECNGYTESALYCKKCSGKCAMQNQTVVISHCALVAHPSERLREPNMLRSLKTT